MDIETTDPTEAPEGMPDLSDERLAAQIPLRHSVRSFTDRRIEGQTRAALQRFVDECNERSGLSFALCTDEPGRSPVCWFATACSAMCAIISPASVRRIRTCKSESAIGESAAFWPRRRWG